MKAVIMAGGLGTRLRPITYEMAKPTVPIAGKPCIYYVIKALMRAGIEDIIITSGYRVEDIAKTVGGFARDLDINIIYSYEYEARGTAGGVKKVESFLDDTFVVASGDVLSHVDFKEVVSYHKKKKAFATMALTHTDNPTEYGIVGLDDSGRITRFKEKPRPEEVFSTLINAGIYVLEPGVLDYIPPKTMFDFSKHTFPKILEDGKGLYGMELKGLWKDIGRPADLLESNRLLALEFGKKAGRAVLHSDSPVKKLKAKNLSGGVYIGEGVEIHPEATVEDGYLHRDVRINKDAWVKNSLIMDGTEVEEGAVIEDSIIMPGSVVSRNSKVYSSIIGSGTIVREGTVLHDMRIWDKNIMTV